MNHAPALPAPRRSATTLAATLLLGVVALAFAPAPARAVSVCKACTFINDTTFTPGRVTLTSMLLHPAWNAPVGFIGPDRGLRLARPSSAGWAVEPVDTQSVIGGVSMTLDAFDQPVLSYHDGAARLVCARRIGSTWLREVVWSGGVAGSTSIASVPGGIGIAFHDSVTGALNYAEQIGAASWSVVPVSPSGAREGRYASLLAHGSGRAISYYDELHGDLRLAVRLGGTWSTSLVDSAGDVGGYTSIVGDSASSGIGIAYYDFTHRDVKYALRGSATWDIQSVDTTGDVGRFCSAVAPGGSASTGVGIAYYDRTLGNLKYATRTASGWSGGPQAAAGDVGANAACGATSSPLDTTGIAYVDQASGDLYYRLTTEPVTSVSPAGDPGRMRLAWLRSPDGAGGTVRFTVPAAGQVRVSVHDAEGRIVAVPLRRSLSAGPAEARWDGRDTRGRAVQSGVFYVSVEAAGTRGSVPAIVLR